MDKETLKFIVLADLHIVPEGELSNSLDTNARLIQSIEFINKNHDDADFVIFAGDLADNGEIESYHRLKKTCKLLKLRKYFTLGNHDIRQNFLKVFNQTITMNNGNLDHSIDTKNHKVLIIDSSHPPYKDPGLIEDSQLSWIKKELNEANDKPVIVVLHHNFVYSHVKAGNMILENNLEFSELLMHSNCEIRQVISGHIHMTTSGYFKGLPFTTFSGSHYIIEPTLNYIDGRIKPPVPRREGPGQIAVVISDKESTVIHMENFIDRHLTMAQELFGKWTKH